VRFQKTGFFWFLQPRNFQNLTLVARRRKHCWFFWAIFLVVKLRPQKSCFNKQEFTRFLTTVSSQHRATPTETSLVIAICLLRVLTYVVSYEHFWNWIGTVRFVSTRVRDLIWLSVCCLTPSSLLYGINFVVVITEYWISNHLSHQWIGRQNQKLETKCITRRCLMKQLRRRPVLFYETKCAAGKTYQTKCAAGQIFVLNPDG